MRKQEYLFVLTSFLIWEIGILIVAFFAAKLVPLYSHNFLGAGYSNYITSPVFWGHLNFDGEHYLALVQNGYQPLTYFFFPLFPYLVNALTISRTVTGFAWTGIFISNLSFLVALVGIYRLVKLDYKESIAKLAVVLFLVFPTSFYFSVYYTEGIFLMLIVWSFLLARKSKFFYASVVAAFASMARLVGIVIFLVLIVEMIIQKKRNILPILISPLGLLIYMNYLWKQTGDPLVFLHQVSIYGQQRSSTLVLLPQVLYRYVFEILPHVSYSYFPNVFTSYLEFLCGVFS